MKEKNSGKKIRLRTLGTIILLTFILRGFRGKLANGLSTFEVTTFPPNQETQKKQPPKDEIKNFEGLLL